MSDAARLPALRRLAHLRGYLAAVAELVWRHDCRVAAGFKPAGEAHDGRALASQLIATSGITRRDILAARLDARHLEQMLKIAPPETPADRSVVIPFGARA